MFNILQVKGVGISIIRKFITAHSFPAPLMISIRKSQTILTKGLVSPMSARNKKSNSLLVARRRLFSQIITVLKFYVIYHEEI